MRYIFKFPDIGEGVHEGKILEWRVKRGQRVNPGDALVKMETDKVVTDIPSPREGVIMNLFGKEGEVIHVDDPLAELELEGVSGADAQAAAHEEKQKLLTAKPVEEKGFGVVGAIEVAGDSAYLPSGDEGLPEKPEPVNAPARKALATPVARAMAKDFNIDINVIPGSGPAGRVMKKDIHDFHLRLQNGKLPAQTSAKTPAPPQTEEILTLSLPLSQIRKTIARNMIRSKQNAAHMTVMEEAEVSELVSLREKYRADYTSRGLKLSYLPFIIKAVTQALKEFPHLNSEMDLENDRLILKKYYHIGLAVDTEMGLVVPALRNADALSIAQLSGQIAELAEKARSRRLTLDDFKDGTFTITNYGAIGGTFGVPVINYPQAAILGVGRILKTPVVKNDQIVVGHLLPLSLSVDHRIVDGAEAARFMTRIIRFLENPVSLMLA